MSSAKVCGVGEIPFAQRCQSWDNKVLVFWGLFLKKINITELEPISNTNQNSEIEEHFVLPFFLF